MNWLSKWDQEENAWKGGLGGGAGDARAFGAVTLGLRASILLINTSDQFSNAPGLIKPEAQFAKCFLPHLNCLDCVEFE